MSARDEIPDDFARLRVPPHSTEAEQSVLGGLLLDNRGFDRVGDLLQSEAFYERRHGLIFGAIARLVSSNRPADVVTVDALLKQSPEDYGGIRYLYALAQSVPSAANVRRYAEIVTERALVRQIIANADEAAALGFRSDGGTAAEKLDRISTMFRGLEAGTLRAAPRSLAELVAARIDHVQTLHEGGEDTSVWPTPMPTLNRLLTGGLRPGRVYVVAARPSIGKSAFAQTLGVQAALQGLPTLFLSQEMPDTELADRILSQLGRVDFGRLQSGRLDDAEWGGLTHGAEVASQLPFFVDDQGSLTAGQIRAKARQVPGLRVLVLDYLQLTASAPTSRGTPNRNAEIEEVSRGLKTLAKELGIAVVMLSQLNRDVEKRQGRRPCLADLRDSGSIEQDADVVLFLWPLQHSAIDGCTVIGFDVAKNRGGEKGDFPVCFWGRHMRWGEAELPLSHYLQTARPGGDL